MFRLDNEKSAQIVMVGTIHRDPAGRRLLSRCIRALNPGLITVEVSPYGITHRRKNLSHWRSLFHRNVRIAARNLHMPLRVALKKPDIVALLHLLNVPYEYETSRIHAAIKAIPVYAIDDSEISRSKLSHIESEVLPVENLEILLQMNGPSWQHQIREGYRRARVLLQSTNDGMLYREAAEAYREMALRDKAIFTRLCDLATCHKRFPMVHVCGWEHLLNICGTFSLYAHLVKEFVVGRVLLR